MKISHTTSSTFKPWSLTLEIESLDEQKSLYRLFLRDISFPSELQKNNEITEQQEIILSDMMSRIVYEMRKIPGMQS